MFKIGDEVEITGGCGYNNGKCHCADVYRGQVGVVYYVYNSHTAYSVRLHNGDSVPDIKYTGLSHYNKKPLSDFI